MRDLVSNTWHMPMTLISTLRTFSYESLVGKSLAEGEEKILRKSTRVEGG